ncbi:MAG: tetratricopeptide repeat protein [Bacillota bacterium]|nr:tetratricopeptide repeat protein [Bacillota bacterium]MDW7677820.1 tetratricopeptide repeat protein [Bacillota bacterium]
MVLHIFSATKKERVMLLKQYIHTDHLPGMDIKSDTSLIQSGKRGIKSVKTQKHYQRVPGYWLMVEFQKSRQGIQLYHQLKKQLPAHRLNEEVFYPQTELPGPQLEEKWLEKYHFNNETLEETSRLFLQEIRGHLKERRPGIAYQGILLLLRLNPFFMKKYRRYYFLEDLAYHYESLGNLGKAVKCFQLQQRIRPDSPEPYLNISSFYIVNGLEDKALPVLRKAIRKHPANPYLMSNLIIAMCNLGQFDAAIMILKKALEKDLQNGFYWKMLGDVFYEIEENDAAIRCFKKAIRFTDKEKAKDLSTDLHSGIAACYYEEGQYKKALDHYLKVLQIHPDDHYTLISLAQLHFYKLKNSSEALNYSKKILEIMPENGYAHYHIGLIYMDLEMMEKARWHLYKARRLMPYYNPIHEAIQLLKKDWFRHSKRQANQLGRPER